jgi:TRAP-type C4-dicarboxylate transport system permease small subunit
MSNVWRRFNRILSVTAGVMLGFVMMIIVLDVCGRIFFNHPITGMVDTVTVMIPIFLFLPLAYVELLDEHIRVEVLTIMMNRRKQLTLDVLASILGVILFAVFAWIAWETAVESWRRAEYYPGLYRIRIYPAKFAIAFGFTLFFVQLLVRGISDVRALFSNKTRSLAQQANE